jgi:hypothetical protein
MKKVPKRIKVNGHVYVLADNETLTKEDRAKAVERVVYPLVDRHIYDNFKQTLSGMDTHTHQAFEWTVQGWVASIVIAVRDAVLRGDDDVSSLDYHNRSRDVAERLWNAGAPGTLESIWNGLRDFEQEIMDDAFTAASV